MALSRLQNLGSNPKGFQLYVDPGNFDATDSIENRGNSSLRPFYSLQRAILEAARYSYVSGSNNDLNDRTTIIVSPGVHYIDNRPGFSITNDSGSAVFRKRTGATEWSTDILDELNENSNFDIFDVNNDLYKYNSVEGGVILPRGTSIVGIDLRKTKIRPLYVPDPSNPNVDRSSIFKITGNCYFTSFTFFDADIATGAYKDYTYEIVSPKFSHHKLTSFTYADGVNKVKLGYEQTELTDLQMFYYKVAKGFGALSGRDVPDYPGNTDFEPVIDEYRIVGVIEENLVGISSIRSGNGTGGGILNEITVTTKDLLSNIEAPHNLSVDTPIIISGLTVNPESYNGSFVVKSVVGPNTFTYVANSIPTIKLPSSNQFNNAVIKVESDTTSSSSPYIFNCSLRSVYGMCGLWADGSKADGFKSVVVAQFTGISLQKDDNAFLLYSRTSNNYQSNTQISQDSTNKPLHTNPYAIYRPDYESFHIKVSNNSFIQCVSIFAIGFAKHFVTETGGDMSITNSNSNFGALALESFGYRDRSFNRDDTGFITHIIPPRDISPNTSIVDWVSIDVGLTTATSNDTNKRLYLYGYNDVNKLPPYKIDGFRLGSKLNDTINIAIGNTTYSSPILMGVGIGTGVSARKEYKVERVSGVNSIGIGSDVITLTSDHQLTSGEKVRVFSDNGNVPDGLENNTIYYVITTGNSKQIKLAYNFNDATASTPSNIVGISNNGGNITIVSSVSDKKPGDVAHPIQWDGSNWYLISSTDSTNKIHARLKELGVSSLGRISPKTYFTRKNDNRTIEDRLYKVRYVIPKDYADIRPPAIGFVLQESKTVGVTTASINPTSNLRVYDRRNEKVINSITAGTISNNTQTVTVKTEAPHRLIEGDVVRIQNVKSTYNPTATGITSTFNGSFGVITVPDSHTFTYNLTGVSTNPGAFTNDIKTRTSATVGALPTVSREQYKNTFVVYRVDTIKEHLPGANGQDGIYYITLISSNVKTSPNIGFGLSTRNYRQDVRDLYPQIDRDNYNVDPQAAVSYGDHLVLGKVITNDKRNSLTKETVEYLLQNNQIGFGITGVILSGIGNTTITIQTNVEHKLNSIKSITLVSGGTGQTGDYYGQRVTIGAVVTDAICNYSTSGGAITSSTIEFVDTGSGFTVGQTIGIGTNGATATVTEINSNVLDGLELAGFIQSDLNGVFRIRSISNNKTIVLESSTPISNYTANTNSRIPFGFLASNAINVSSYQFNNLSTGIVTVTTSQAHGLLEGNNFKIVGSGSSIYNSNFVVGSVVGINTFTFNVGIATTIPTTNVGTIYRRTLYPNAKSTGKTGENLGNRLNYIYSGISTTINSIASTATQITFSSSSTGLTRGDYIQVNDEIMRLTSNAGGGTFNVERGMFGTLKASANSGTRAYKIKIIPVELRRPSFMRASGHTFEYLGYGPGNYSTSVPQKQTRRLLDDDILVSQSKKVSGGTVVYSGMNDLGEFYYGAKRVSSVTGQETIIEAPILTYTGDDADGSDDPSKLSEVFDNILVRQKITVEGGENGEDTSFFNGPVKFTKLVSALEGGINSKFISLNNKKFSYNSDELISKDESPAIGDIIFSPPQSNYIGKIKFSNTSWRRWGIISNTENTWDINLDKLTATDIVATNSLKVNGVTFGANGIDELTLGRLRVTGISTFQGAIYGDNGVIGFANTASVSNGISTTYIRGDGRTIDIGASSTYPQYGLRLTRTSTIEPSKSQILHSGTEPLEIRADSSYVSIAKDNSTPGTAGANLAIINNNADAVTSWRGGSTGYWFAGMKASDSTWNLAYAPSPIGIVNGNFTSESTKVGVNTLGQLSANSIAVNTTGIGTGDIGSDGGADKTFGIFNTSIGSTIIFGIKNNSGGYDNVLTLTPNGGSVPPIGGIIMWSGSIAEAEALMPYWALCNGNNGTPDLRDRFIVAASQGTGVGTVSTPGPGFNPITGALNPPYTYTPGNVGGETAHQLTIPELAQHRHSFYNPANPYELDGGNATPGSSKPAYNSNQNNLSYTDYQGSNYFHENRPPYYALAFIMRIK
jgi:hypothetical protein